ncbi:MAG: hypothetical protein NZ524_04450 [Thiobacillaceae bacterium]|nr:hypothetical protein [Thiobacillaceae bacterium]MDW8323694.1 hypothetical protein [Burkholderiales bacterium]
MPIRTIRLHKVCPRCGGRAQAEGKLLGGPGPWPPVYDLDDLPNLAQRLSLSSLLALIELVPYKQFDCLHCGHVFRLENGAAKDMALGMLAALRPVASTAPLPPRSTRPVYASISAPLPTASSDLSAIAPMSTDPQRAQLGPDEWEPEGLD